MAEESAALIPTRQQTVEFYGDPIAAAQVGSGEIYVPIRPLCDFLGLGWGSQYNRLRRDEVLRESLHRELGEAK